MSNENTLDYILGEALRAAEMRQGCTDYTPYVEALKRDIESHYKGLAEALRKEGRQQVVEWIKKHSELEDGMSATDPYRWVDERDWQAQLKEWEQEGK